MKGKIVIYNPDQKFVEAVSYVTNLFKNKYRKGTDTSYLSHLLGTASLVMEYGGNEDECIAALLHDVFEDIGWNEAESLYDKFGETVYFIVKECTDYRQEKDWKKRKEDYIRVLKDKSESALLVTYCDKLHNSSCIVSDLYTYGTVAFNKFKGKQEGVVWYYNALVSASWNLELPTGLMGRFARNVITINMFDNKAREDG